MTSRLVSMMIFAGLLLSMANATGTISIKGVDVMQGVHLDSVRVQFWLANNTLDNVASNGKLHIIVNHTKSFELLNKTIEVKDSDFKTNTSALRPTDGPFFDKEIAIDKNLPEDTMVDAYLTFTTPEGKVLTDYRRVDWEGD